MGQNIQVAVIEDAGLMRDGLCALLKAAGELQVVGAIDSNAQEIRSARIDTPDVAVIESCVSSVKGAEVVSAVKERWPGVRILLLTLRSENPLLHPALHEGIEGYVLMTESGADLVAAIRAVSAGQRYAAPHASGEGNGAGSPAARGPTLLSDREREVMRLIAEGYRTREMAQQLSLSHKTIEKHRSNLMRKLGLRSATAVAAYAITRGYVVLTF